jgi:hypothetical protein
MLCYTFAVNSASIENLQPLLPPNSEVGPDDDLHVLQQPLIQSYYPSPHSMSYHSPLSTNNNHDKETPGLLQNDDCGFPSNEAGDIPIDMAALQDALLNTIFPSDSQMPNWPPST